jgi:hypothetical protein
LFIYANINEVNLQISDEFLCWLNYKPTRGDDEILNLLVLDLIEDVNLTSDFKINEPIVSAQTHTQKWAKKFPEISQLKQTKSRLIKRAVLIRQTDMKTNAESANSYITTSSTSKPTIFDTYYDLLKSIHLQITVRPINLEFRNSTMSSKCLGLSLPQIDIKSSGTKCDLEEELISNNGNNTKSSSVELPCTYLRACEKTSNKLPWVVDVRNLNAFITDLIKYDKEFLIKHVDFSTHFAVKPKYNQYDNLLSSLSIYFNIEAVKPIDLDLRDSQIEFLIILITRILDTLVNFDYKIDYSELDDKFTGTKLSNDLDDSSNLTNNTNTDYDDTVSYSSISILKEHDFDEEEEKEIIKNNQEINEDCRSGDFESDEEHCSLSTGEISSVSSALSSSILEPKPSKKLHKLKITSAFNKKVTPLLKSLPGVGLVSPVVHSILRERSEEQVKLNFTLQIAVNRFNLTMMMVNDEKKIIDENYLKFSFDRMISQLDLNNVYQKFLFKIKAFEVYTDRKNNYENNDNNLIDRTIFTSNSKLFNDELYLNLNKINENESETTQKSSSFVEFTFTRALVSNFNKKLEEMNRSMVKLPNLISSSGIKTATPIKEREVDDSDHLLNRKQVKKLNRSLSSTNKWISEFNMNINNIDMVLHAEKMYALIKFLTDLNLQIHKHNLLNIGLKTPENLTQYSNESTVLVPIITSSDLPLMNIEVGQIRFILPFYENKKSNFDLIIKQIQSIKFTSQIEYPIIRNFLYYNNNSASHKIYNKYRSNGMLYRPGFAFEDRQYLMEIKNIALFKSNSASLISKSITEIERTMIINSFNLKSIVGLPIFYQNRLINGYVLEINIITPNLEFYLGSSELNLVFGVLNQNLNIINNWKSILDSRIRNESVTKSPFAKNKDYEQTILDLVPCDFLVTAENISFFIFEKETPILLMECKQPHISFLIHERLQKFEILVFDYSLKKAAETISGENLFTTVSDRNIYKLPVIETKPSEPNPKTGILAGFFLFRINNFVQLLSQNSKSNSSSLREIKIPENIEKNLEIVCNECLRCFDLSGCEPISPNRSVKRQSQLVNTQIMFERPVKIKANSIIYEQLYKYLNSLSLFCDANSKIESKIHEKKENKASIDWLFNLNIRLFTAQFVFIFELSKGNNASTSNSMILSFTTLSINLNKSLINNNNYADEDYVNHSNLKLNDFHCKLETIERSQQNQNVDYVHFLGPFTLKFYSFFSPRENKIFANIDLGSFNVSFNRKLADFFDDLAKFIKEQLNQVRIF